MAANMPLLGWGGVLIQEEEGNHILQLVSQDIDGGPGANVRVTVRSFVDLGDYDDPNNPARTGRLFRLNGDTELKVLRWGAGWEDQPGVYFKNGDIDIAQVFDWMNPADGNPTYQPLVEYLQQHLIPEEQAAPGAQDGGRRRRTRRNRHNRRIQTRRRRIHRH
jgi:hypothetical protein